MKNKEWVRGMTDEELADFLLEFSDSDELLHYCRNLAECGEDLNADREIPLERCRGCVMLWLEGEHAESEK